LQGGDGIKSRLGSSGQLGDLDFNIRAERGTGGSGVGRESCRELGAGVMQSGNFRPKCRYSGIGCGGQVKDGLIGHFHFLMDDGAKNAVEPFGSFTEEAFGDVVNIVLNHYHAPLSKSSSHFSTPLSFWLLYILEIEVLEIRNDLCAI
jgi:hypothetical protein